MMMLAHLLSWLSAIVIAAPITDHGDLERVRQLKEYIEKERPAFERRKAAQRNLLEELDHVNSNQNEVRKKIQSIQNEYQELAMASDNLAVEHENQKKRELLQKAKVTELLKVAHRIKRDGLLRFLIQGRDSSLSARVRVLLMALRSQALLAKKLEQKAAELSESERRLAQARQESRVLLEEMNQQGEVLQDLLQKKTEVLKKISRQQAGYKAVFDEYRQMSKQMQHLFAKFEAQRVDSDRTFPKRGTIRLPVDSGRVIRSFGRQIHAKFQTVTFEQGIQIEADHNSPVYAVLPGIVEFEGWVKGLGNVVIVHHGGGFYSLNANLYTAASKVGSEVKQGDLIGTVGDTGDNDHPGLYFELRENGKPVDPLMYFSPEAIKNLT